MTATTLRSHPVHALLGETVAVTLMPERADRSAATLLFDADEAPADGAAPAEPQATAAARYEFVGTLGAGGMGEVLAARDKRLRRLVAFKKLLPEAAANPRVLARFLCEAQITSQLDHPNVVPIYGLEVNEGGCSPTP
ncbi:MAG: hypothetical protein U1F43_29355 [Myxococcota bacterium]